METNKINNINKIFFSFIFNTNLITINIIIIILKILNNIIFIFYIYTTIIIILSSYSLIFIFIIRLITYFIIDSSFTSRFNISIIIRLKFINSFFSFINTNNKQN